MDAGNPIRALQIETVKGEPDPASWLRGPSTGFGNSREPLDELRNRLRAMSEYELVAFGKAQREAGRSAELQEAQKEWRRRHPKKTAVGDREL